MRFNDNWKMKPAEYAPFDGRGQVLAFPDLKDTIGRVKAPAADSVVLVPQHIPYIPGMHSRPIRMSNARKLIDEFCRHGMMIHSAHSSCIWVLLQWCRRHNRQCVVEIAGDEEHKSTAIYLDHKPKAVTDLDVVFSLTVTHWEQY